MFTSLGLLRRLAHDQDQLPLLIGQTGGASETH
jgi:hypothetical protein